MTTRRCVLVALLCSMIAGCATSQAPTAVDRAAVAPTGALRVGFLQGPLYATKDSGGEFRGIAPDLGRQLAQYLGVPFVAVPYASVPALLDGAKAGQWDLAFAGILPERAALLDFSPPVFEVEQGFLVRPGASIASDADVDRPGVRIGVLEKSGADAFLTRELKQAQVVRAPGNGELYALLVDGRADVVAATKNALFMEAVKLPGSRVLDGRLLVEPIGAAVPKGRDPAAAATVSRFFGQAQADGRVHAAIARAGVRGVTVAPPKP